MESTIDQVIISNPLPFMTKSFVERKFLSKYKDAQVNIIHKFDLPYTIIISFPSKDNAQSFVNQFNAVPFDDKLNYKIAVSEYPTINEKEISDLEMKDRKQIVFAYEYHNFIHAVYERTLKTSGLLFTDKEIMGRQDKAIGYLIKKAGSTLLKGQSIMNISLPVYIFDKRTLLQVLAYELSLAPYILSRVYFSLNVIEKLKWMSTFLMSQLFMSPLQTKPFCPIIGETLQSKIGNLNIYMEQTVHKPPTCNFYCFDDEKLYNISGFIATTASTGANNVKAFKLGKYIVKFKDGSMYQVYFPQVFIKGTTIGKRLFSFKHVAMVVDLVNGYAAYIKLNPDEKGFIKSIFSSKQKTYPDTFKGDVIKLSSVTIHQTGAKHSKAKDSVSYCKIEGEWTSHISFNDVTYWKTTDYNLLNMYSQDYLLPSDSSFREDLTLVINNDEANAQIAKENLEEIQRKDRKLRAQALEKK